VDADVGEASGRAIRLKPSSPPEEMAIVKTPGIFALKGKPGFDRCCHRHSTS
jgi:hypothetical protein